MSGLVQGVQRVSASVVSESVVSAIFVSAIFEIMSNGPDCLRSFVIICPTGPNPVESFQSVQPGPENVCVRSVRVPGGREV